MKLDRNGPDGRGKYAVVKLRKMPRTPTADEVGTFKAKEALAREALNFLIAGGFVTIGTAGDTDEFFVVMLRDRYAHVALNAYADAAQADDPEYAADVRALANRAGPYNPGCKTPD